MLAFSIGLLSTLHCFGMCGGIVGILTMSLAPPLRNNRRTLFYYNLAYNLGRILSYTLAGLLLGFVGQTLLKTIMPEWSGVLLRILSSVLVIVLGLYISGLFSKFALIEKLGIPIWKKLQPISQKLLPVSSLPQAVLFGMVWGWLPCGLVYYVLIMSVASENPFDAALYMALFGAGTLLPLLMAGLFAGKLTHLRHKQWLRNISSGLLILVGVIGLLLIFNGSSHHFFHKMNPFL